MAWPCNVECWSNSHKLADYWNGLVYFTSPYDGPHELELPGVVSVDFCFSSHIGAPSPVTLQSRRLFGERCRAAAMPLTAIGYAVPPQVRRGRQLFGIRKMVIWRPCRNHAIHVGPGWFQAVYPLPTIIHREWDIPNLSIHIQPILMFACAACNCL